MATEISRYFAWLTSFPEGTLAIFLVLLVFAAFIWWKVQDFWCWLKGSRRSYYIGLNNIVVQSSSKRRNLGPYSVIEISRGPFRRRSAIYGSAAKNWKITSSRTWPNGNWFWIKCRKPVRDENALQLINTYPSFQAMLDDIATTKSKLTLSQEQCEEFRKRTIKMSDQMIDLETDLANARRAERRWLSALGALLVKINLDRQRFRSQAAQEIREDLEVVLGGALAMPDAHSAVTEWLNTFKARRFEARHGCK